MWFREYNNWKCRRGGKCTRKQPDRLAGKTNLPKKSYNNSEGWAEQEVQSGNMKKLKINNLNLQELKEKPTAKQPAQMEILEKEQ